MEEAVNSYHDPKKVKKTKTKTERAMIDKRLHRKLEKFQQEPYKTEMNTGAPDR